MVSKKKHTMLSYNSGTTWSFFLDSHYQAILPYPFMTYIIWLKDHKYMSIANTQSSHENQPKKQ